MYLPGLRHCRWHLAALAIVMLGCDGKAPDKDALDAPPAARVVVAEVRGGSVIAKWSFLGDVRALRHAELAAGAEGEVRKVTMRVGDHVKRGDLLVEVDPSLAAARLRAAESSKEAGSAQFDQAERDAERLSTAGNDLVSLAEIEQAGSEKKRAEAERGRLDATEAEARAELGRHRVRAPFDGVVARRLVDPGDWVQPGVQVMELVDDKEVEVLTSVPPQIARYLQEGAKATLRYKGASATATVRGVVRALDEESRTVRLRLVPDEHLAWMLPGAAVDVQLNIERQEQDALVVPRDAIVYGVANTQVIKVKDGKSAPVPVEILASSQNEVLVRAKDLKPKDSLVTRGNERLRPGQAVQIVSEN